jgi:hypothetical protein
VCGNIRSGIELAMLRHLKEATNVKS